MGISIIKNVEDINLALNALRTKLQISIEDVDIKIESFTTFIQNDNSYELIDNHKINDDIFFENHSFKQVFDISISKKIQNDYAIRINNNFESMDLIFGDNFEYPNDEKQIIEFFKIINALKAKNGVILRNLEDEEKLLKNSILKKLDSIRLCKAPKFREAKEPKLEFEMKNINTEKKNYISIGENEKIATFHYEKEGVDGRNLAGKYINVKQIKLATPKVSKEIKEEKTQNGINYYSIEGGFIIFENNEFSFAQKVQLMNVGLKDNYNFAGKIDSASNLIINTDNEINDALSNGLSIVANTIVINGNIGINTKIHGFNVKITGQTHKGSVIEALNAEINTHRGYVEGENVKILNLETGEVIANNINILRAHGGNISCNKIQIRDLISNNVIQFSKECEIKNLLGKENKMIFSSLAPRKKETKELLNKQKDLDEKIQKIQNKINFLKNKFSAYEKMANELKNIIDTKQSIPSYVRNNYNIFLKLKQNIEAYKIALENVENEKNLLNLNLQNEQSNINNAKLICKNGWVENNTIELNTQNINKARNIKNGKGNYIIKNNEIILSSNR